MVSNKNKEAFSSSLKKYVDSDKCAYDRPGEALTSSKTSMTAASCTALVLLHERKLLEAIGELEEELESPIEVMMLNGLLVAFAMAYVDDGGVIWLPGGVTLVSRSGTRYRWGPFWDDEAHHLEIAPQKRIGEYRVDFLLTATYATWMPDFDNVDEKGVPGSQLERYETKLVVECDGHDFHERTKEQASHDKKRDRALTTFGLPVYRYTGSDIFRDVMGHADEIIRTLAIQIERSEPSEIRRP